MDWTDTLLASRLRYSSHTPPSRWFRFHSVSDAEELLYDPMRHANSAMDLNEAILGPFGAAAAPTHVQWLRLAATRWRKEALYTCQLRHNLKKFRPLRPYKSWAALFGTGLRQTAASYGRKNCRPTKRAPHGRRAPAV